MCELIGGGSPRHLNSFSNLKNIYIYFVAEHYTHQYTLCIVAIITAPKIKVGYSFHCGLGNIAQENITADILIEDQLQPPLDMITVDQERELHRPNS